MIVPILWAASYVREQLMQKSIVKGLLGISVLALVSSWVVLVSAAPKVIDIEPNARPAVTTSWACPSSATRFAS
jgi:hypothetical protein